MCLKTVTWQVTSLKHMDKRMVRSSASSLFYRGRETRDWYVIVTMMDNQQTLPKDHKTYDTRLNEAFILKA